MDFGLSQDQHMLRDAVSRCLADTSPLSHVRACAERDNPLSDQVLRALNDLGVAGMLVPAAHGGLGMPLLGAAVVAEPQNGRASCRERVLQYVSVSVVTLTLKKKKT